jgi:hypothetical protein
MTTDPTLSLSTVTHIINAPLEKVNIADWLFNLPDAEYQRCSPAYIAAGHTTSDDGRPMSINVETIGGALMVQHFCRNLEAALLSLDFYLRCHRYERAYQSPDCMGAECQEAR